MKIMKGTFPGLFDGEGRRLRATYYAPTHLRRRGFWLVLDLDYKESVRIWDDEIPADWQVKDETVDAMLCTRPFREEGVTVYREVLRRIDEGFPAGARPVERPATKATAGGE